MKRNGWIVGLALLVFAGSACGPAAVTTAPPLGEVAPTSAPPEAQPTSPPEVPAGQDLSQYVACEIVTRQEVADMVGGPIYRELDSGNLAICSYEIAAGPQDYTLLQVAIWPPDYVQPAVDNNMTELLGEPVAGMGDAAFIKHEEGSPYELTVLVRDRFGLEVSADTEEWTMTLAQLFLGRLLGP